MIVQHGLGLELFVAKMTGVLLDDLLMAQFVVLKVFDSFAAETADLHVAHMRTSDVSQQVSLELKTLATMIAGEVVVAVAVDPYVMMLQAQFHLVLKMTDRALEVKGLAVGLLVGAKLVRLDVGLWTQIALVGSLVHVLHVPFHLVHIVKVLVAIRTGVPERFQKPKLVVQLLLSLWRRVSEVLLLRNLKKFPLLVVPCLRRYDGLSARRCQLQRRARNS